MRICMVALSLSHTHIRIVYELFLLIFIYCIIHRGKKQTTKSFTQNVIELYPLRVFRLHLVERLSSFSSPLSIPLPPSLGFRGEIVEPSP